jgi:hypothetical protein
MLHFFRRARRRDIYFHEDDYCQQQILPLDAKAFADEERKRITEFADAHRAPDGVGWTEMCMRSSPPVELRALAISRYQFSEAISRSFAPFDDVYTGYSSHRERCNRTAAWGRSPTCALFADWDEAEMITNCWAMFFDQEESSIQAAAQAVAVLGDIQPLVYVDWAWGYTCEVSKADAFSDLLRTKLRTIAENVAAMKKG